MNWFALNVGTESISTVTKVEIGRSSGSIVEGSGYVDHMFVVTANVIKVHGKVCTASIASIASKASIAGIASRNIMNVLTTIELRCKGR